VYQIDNLVASSTAIDLNTELNTQLNLLNTASTTIMDMGMGTIRTIATAGKFARARCNQNWYYWTTGSGWPCCLATTITTNTTILLAPLLTL